MIFTNKLFSIITISFLALSCSSIKLKNDTTIIDKTKKIESLKLIAENQKIIHEGSKIGEFVLKEDFTEDWNYLKNKIIEFAKSKGSNLIEIKTIGWGKKGHAFYADGSLYYVNDIEKIETNIESNCSIFIIRDNTEAPISSTFTIDLKINEEEFKNLRKNKVIKKELLDCNKTVTVSINGKINTVNLNGRSKYFKVAKQTMANSMGNGVSIGIGGISFIEIENEEIGRLIMYQNQ